VDPVPDPLLLRKSSSAGYLTRDLWICSQKLWPLDHRGCPSTSSTCRNPFMTTYVQTNAPTYSDVVLATPFDDSNTPGWSGNFSDISVWRDFYTLWCRRCDQITERTQVISYCLRYRKYKKLRKCVRTTVYWQSTGWSKSLLLLFCPGLTFQLREKAVLSKNKQTV
jgi:hypothetical protein